MRFTEFSLSDQLKIGQFHDRKITLSNLDKPIRFQIPRMYMPFGLSTYAQTNRWNIDFSMKGFNEEGNYVKRFYEFVKELENAVIQYIHVHSTEIFGKSRTVEDIRSMFLSNIKENDQEPKFRLKVDVDVNNTIISDVFDIEDNSINDEVERGLYSKKSGVALVEVGSVYFMNNQIGLVWRLAQLKIYETQRLKGFQFLTS